MNAADLLERMSDPESEYRELAENPDLAFMQYIALGGSHAYGTSTESSDVDLRGWYMPCPEDILGMGNRKESDVELRNTDSVFHSFHKIARLLSQCNPSIIESMGVRDRDILYMSPMGKRLKENAGMFLSKRAFATFAGYATQQLRRIENALARDSYPQAEKENHILKSLEEEMLAAHDAFSAFDKGSEIRLYLADSSKEGYDQEIHMDLSLRHVPLRDFVGLRNQFSNMLKNYGKLRHRNKKKDANHLRKHAMHLIRLHFMAIDILREHRVITYREKEHDLLMSIRHGEMPLEKVFDLQRRLGADLQKARDESTLPERPDEDRINAFVAEETGKFLADGPASHAVSWSGLAHGKSTWEGNVP